MYPLDILALFPPFPREDNVFVIMPFQSAFQSRWLDVIQPAIRMVTHEGRPLTAIRADTRRVSDSILTDIVSAIATSRLVLADITSMPDDGRPTRNGNVMYEVGIAHATRLPEEVILVRSDHETLLFDVANVRVNAYDADAHPEEATTLLAGLVQDALTQADTRKHLAVRHALDSLDFHTMGFLLALHGTPEGIVPPKTRTMRDAMSAVSQGPAIQRALEIGLARVKIVGPDALDRVAAAKKNYEDLVRYEITPFGRAVVDAAYIKFGITALQNQIDNIKTQIEEAGATQ